jgi:hypothetical protein
MPEAFSHSSSRSRSSIERPRCPRCQTRMSLAQIMSGPSGQDLRTFECTKCQHVRKEVAPTGPMKSDALRWLAGNLKPSK